MALPLLPIIVLGGTSLVASGLLQARALRSDDLEPDVLGVPLNGLSIGLGAALAVLAPGIYWSAAGTGMVFGGAHSVLTGAQVARATDPEIIGFRGGKPPAWIVRSHLIPFNEGR